MITEWGTHGARRERVAAPARLLILCVMMLTGPACSRDPVGNPPVRGGGAPEPRLYAPGDSEASPVVSPTLIDRAAGGERPVPPDLMIPVVGVGPGDLRNNFGAPRGESRRHKGIDIPAPSGTAVVSAVDGWVWKLRWNRLGGRTAYVLDASGEYILYYAHLKEYAGEVREGRPVRRGEVLGYIGTTGNADAGPHLHLRVGRLDDPERYWDNDPIDPYPLLLDAPGPRRGAVAARTAPGR